MYDDPSMQSLSLASSNSSIEMIDNGKKTQQSDPGMISEIEIEPGAPNPVAMNSKKAFESRVGERPALVRLPSAEEAQVSSTLRAEPASQQPASQA